MSDDAFSPFGSGLDPEDALQVLRETLAGAEDGELFFERRRGESLVLDDQRIRSANYDASEGFGLRAVNGPVTGYAHSTEISLAGLRRAAETARLAIGTGGGTYAVAPTGSNRALYDALDPVADASFSVKLDVLREIDAHARDADPRVVQVTATLMASAQEVLILRSEGHQLRDMRPMARMNVSVILEENGRRETGYAGGGGRHGLVQLMDRSYWAGLVAEAIRIADVNLRAEDAPAGVMDVALGSGWTGILLHEAVGHGLEGDFTRRGASAFSDLIGTQVAAKGVTVVDDGTLPHRRGSLTIDDEGTASARTVLIEDGVLTGFMQDRQNARLAGTTSTGNCRRQSFAHAPMVRMTNTYMEPGESDPASLVAEVKDGIWAVGFGGGQVDITSGKFVFSCTEAYRVKNGHVGTPIKGATLIGDGASALKQIRAVASDFALDPGLGTCGKQGQSVPVGVGQPSLLIGGLTVGGSGV